MEMDVITPDDACNKKGEMRIRVDRREEMLRLKGLWDDPVYRERTKDELEEKLPTYPNSDQACNEHQDDETCNCNFKKSFSPDNVEGYLKALDVYGMCIIRLFDEETCDRTVESMFREINAATIFHKGSQEMPIHPSHPASWEKQNWPTKGKFLVRDPAFTQEAYNNRTSKLLFNVYKEIFCREDLNCSIDNWGLFRGTKDLVFTVSEYQKWFDKRAIARQQFETQYRREKNGEEAPEDDLSRYNIRFEKNEEGEDIVKMDRPDWRHCLKPHWDLNPWKWLKEMKRGDPHQYQSLVAINNCPEEVGGFACIPGSHHFVKEWCAEHKAPHNKNKTTRVPEGDQIINRLQHIPLRKGELVIWNSALVHCNFPNYSPNMRLIQFIRMLPAISCCENKDRYAAKRILHQYAEQRQAIQTDQILLSPRAKALLSIAT